jgi:hypothetical protein
MKILSLFLMLILIGCSKPGSNLNQDNTVANYEVPVVYEVQLPDSGSFIIGTKEELGETALSSSRLSTYLNFSIVGDDHVVDIISPPNRSLIMYEKFNGKVFAFSFAGQSASLAGGDLSLDLADGISSWVKLPINGNTSNVEASIDSSPLVVIGQHALIGQNQSGQVEVKVNSSVIGSFSIERSQRIAYIRNLVHDTVFAEGFDSSMGQFSKVGPNGDAFHSIDGMQVSYTISGQVPFTISEGFPTVPGETYTVTVPFVKNAGPLGELKVMAHDGVLTTRVEFDVNQELGSGSMLDSGTIVFQFVANSEVSSIGTRHLTSYGSFLIASITVEGPREIK